MVFKTGLFTPICQTKLKLFDSMRLRYAVPYPQAPSTASMVHCIQYVLQVYHSAKSTKSIASATCATSSMSAASARSTRSAMSTTSTVFAHPPCPPHPSHQAPLVRSRRLTSIHWHAQPAQVKRFDGCVCFKPTVKLIPISGSSFLAGLASSNLFKACAPHANSQQQTCATPTVRTSSPSSSKASSLCDTRESTVVESGRVDEGERGTPTMLLGRDRVPRSCRRYERLMLSVGATFGGRNECEKLCCPSNVASERV